MLQVPLEKNEKATYFAIGCAQDENDSIVGACTRAGIPIYLPEYFFMAIIKQKMPDVSPI